MDGERFDDLARRLASSLPRRTLLQRVSAALVGAVLAGPGASVGAQGCICLPEQTCCSGILISTEHSACCNADAICTNGPAGEPHCQLPCPDGRAVCGGFCCFPGETCCGLGQCCRAGWECIDLGVCSAPCPEGPRCGNRCCSIGQTCCGLGAQAICCDAGEICDGGQCVEGEGCPGGGAQCGASCCNTGETCQNGQCVAGCPVNGQSTGRRGAKRHEIEPQEACPICPSGQVYCPGFKTCVLECHPGTLNMTTCACECEGPQCGDECCPAGQECSSPGGFGENAPLCCLAGQSCGVYCASEPSRTCCKRGPEGTGYSCNAKTELCCNYRCCKRGREQCVHGTCKRKKQKKRK
jgi:hypothetical protein